MMMMMIFVNVKVVYTIRSKSNRGLQEFVTGCVDVAVCVYCGEEGGEEAEEAALYYSKVCFCP